MSIVLQSSDLGPRAVTFTGNMWNYTDVTAYNNPRKSVFWVYNCMCGSVLMYMFEFPKVLSSLIATLFDQT